MNVLAMVLSVYLCGICHPDTATVFERSVHKIEGIQCHSCHGGNPSSLDEKIAHSTDFRKIPRNSIPEHCGSCHSDPLMMLPYGIGSNQLHLYLSSTHGKDYKKSLKKPICTDCHGVHDIKKSKEPDSHTNPLNIIKICGKCHSGKGSPVEEYIYSYHYEVWKEKGNAPVCTTCHDSHLTIKFRSFDVDKLCGRCHGSSRESFMEGTHGTAFLLKGKPSCTDCHNSHSIKKSEKLLFSDSCKKCHSEDSREYKLGKKIAIMLENTRDEIMRTEKILGEAEKIPISIEDYRARIEEAESYFTEALTVTHSLSLEKCEEILGKARFIAKETEGEIHQKIRNLKWRKFGLFVLWFYLFLTIFIIIRYKKWLIKRKSEK